MSDYADRKEEIEVADMRAQEEEERLVRMEERLTALVAALKIADTLADEALTLVGSKAGTGDYTDQNSEDVREAAKAFHRAVADLAAEKEPPAV